MGEILRIAFEVITPILLCAAIGYWFGRRFKPDARMISQISLYIMLPALAFVSIANSELDFSEIGDMALVVFGMSIIMAVLGWGLSRTQRGLAPATQSAFVLTIVLSNSGNFGLPFIEFAFGDEGLQRAAVIFVLTVIVANTLGIYVASSGTATIGQGIRNVFGNPLPYATALGFLVNITDFTVPIALDRAITIYADGSVPILLLLLGVQLSLVSFEGLPKVSAIGLATIARLIITPVVIFGLATLLGVTGITRDVLVLQLSTPTAINAAVFSNEFGSDIEFVSPTILVTTLASVLTLSVLLGSLQ